MGIYAGVSLKRASERGKIQCLLPEGYGQIWLSYYQLRKVRQADSCAVSHRKNVASVTTNVLLSIKMFVWYTAAK